MILPNPCYKIEWQKLIRKNNKFIISANVTKLNKICIQVLTKRTKTFELGKLNPGNYEILARIDGFEKSLNFSVKGLEFLSLAISPKYIELNQGGILNCSVSIDWMPKNWSGNITLTALIYSNNFKRILQEVNLTAKNATKKVLSIRLPTDLPSGEYKLKIIANYGKVKASDVLTIKVKSKSIPGFEALIGILSASLAFILRKFAKD